MLERKPIPVMKAGPGGHEFVLYGDSCSGIAGAEHEHNLRQVNATIRALAAPPQFICFLGDEIMGLTADPQELRRQWRYFFEREMAWLDRARTPLYHVTGNHTVYDASSESMFREVMAHLPQNGPPDQRGLSCYVRRGDLLLVFVNTLWSGSGGEGMLETEWLEAVLGMHADARHKLVCGHHPVWTINGNAGDYQRTIERDMGQRFWQILARNRVLAYLCSHMLAFDVQAHEGVLQICTAGAGTAHLMPPEHEYLHMVQAALDEDGLRYQAVDTAGRSREWLSWDWPLPPAGSWKPFDSESAGWLPRNCLNRMDEARLVVWEISGVLTFEADRQPQTLICGKAEGDALPHLWLGISGDSNELTALLGPEAKRSPHRWRGPTLPAEGDFSIQFAIHSGMGPGGLLWRWGDDQPWSSLIAASAWGAEQLPWPQRWSIGRGGGQRDFAGHDLQVRWHHLAIDLSDYLREPTHRTET